MYANCSDDNSSAEGAVGYQQQPSSAATAVQNQTYENVYETVNNDPSPSNDNPHQEQGENIYESIDDLRRRNDRQDQLFYPPPPPPPENINIPVANINDIPGCSSTTYGRIGNTYGRIDIIGHGIGRIERHLSSSCGSGIDSNHYSNMEGIYSSASGDPTGRISKVSVQWLLINKWLPLWIANTENGRDYRIIDFLLGHRGDYEGVPPQGGASQARRDEPSDDEGRQQQENPNSTNEHQPPPPPPPPQI